MIVVIIDWISTQGLTSAIPSRKRNIYSSSKETRVFIGLATQFEDTSVNYSVETCYGPVIQICRTKLKKAMVINNSLLAFDP